MKALSLLIDVVIVQMMHQLVNETYSHLNLIWTIIAFDILSQQFHKIVKNHCLKRMRVIYN